MNITKALTIAGSDSGGGAGIQADLKTFQELGAYGMSAITAVTAQNTKGVQDVFPLPVEFIEKQIDSIGDDLGTDALKTGMLFSSDIIKAVSHKIKYFGWVNLVVDPVMVAKGGARLMQEEALQAIKHHLLPLAKVVTPNIPEAEILSDMSIQSLEDKKEAAQRLIKLGASSVVIKGGHEKEDQIVDLLFDGSEYVYLKSERIDTKHTHGTGCTFSAAITAELSKGKTVKEAVQTAKDFIQAAIQEELGIGSGHGPTNHWAYRKK
jgi:hydroxymethylpyrimidine/phosphomethylpyrimidine kinase